jgi:hypothetical protein
MRLNDPAYQDSAPSTGGDSHPSGGDRFCPSPLGRAVTSFVHRSLERGHLRRKTSRAILWGGWMARRPSIRRGHICDTIASGCRGVAYCSSALR